MYISIYLGTMMMTTVMSMMMGWAGGGGAHEHNCELSAGASHSSGDESLKVAEAPLRFSQ